MPIPEMPMPALEQLCAVLGETNGGLTGAEIGRYLKQAGLDDPEPATTKRHRLFAALSQRQRQDGCANNIIGFLKLSFDPVRHVDCPEYLDRKRIEINRVLAFVGIEFTETGECRSVIAATTLKESALRADRLRTLLRDRSVHQEVLEFCREELLVENYFHAVLEATKSVAEKIRRKTGLGGDGSELVDDAFAFKSRIPHLALNRLVTDCEQSEQKGFMNLLKGLFGTFRNPTAHAPKITWKIDELDALDILSMVSLAHRRLDTAVEAHKLTTNATKG